MSELYKIWLTVTKWCLFGKCEPSAVQPPCINGQNKGENDTCGTFILWKYESAVNTVIYFFILPPSCGCCHCVCDIYASFPHTYEYGGESTRKSIHYYYNIRKNNNVGDVLVLWQNHWMYLYTGINFFLLTFLPISPVATGVTLLLLLF